MKRFILLLAVLCPLFSFAQNNFKPGAIVTLKGDTVRGYVDYQEWQSNPKFVNFKTTAQAGSKYTRYQPQEIQYFRVDGLEAYRSYYGRISMDDTDIRRLSNGIDTSSVVEHAFLKILSVGNYITLYAYTDFKKTRFYFQEPDMASPVELTFRRYYDRDAQNHTVYQNGYMQQLYLVAEKHNTATDRTKSTIEKSDYNSSDLIPIAELINEGKIQSKKSNKNAPKSVKFYAGLGANFSYYDSFGHYKELGGGSHTSVLPKADVGVLFFANPNTQRLAFRVEASIAQAKYKSGYTISGITTPNNTTFPVEFDQLTYSFTPQVTYNIYNAADFKWYFGAGVGFNFFSVKSIQNPNPTLFVYRNYDSAGILRTGVIISKNFNIDLQYVTKTTVTRNDNYGVEMGAIQLGLNYLFGK